MTKNNNKKKKDPDQSNTALVEGLDYYLNDKGLMVFTATYHLKRGYCCKSQCKHCPYGTSRNPAV